MSDKMAFRPGTVDDGLLVQDYNLDELVFLITHYQLRFDDWIVTQKSEKYIRQNWIALFAKSSIARQSVDVADMSFQERMEHHKRAELENLLHKHSGVLYRVEKYEGVKRVVLYRALGKERITQIREQYDQTQRYGFCDHSI